MATTILAEETKGDFALAIYDFGATGWNLGMNIESIMLYLTASTLILFVVIDYTRRKRRWNSGI